MSTMSITSIDGAHHVADREWICRVIRVVEMVPEIEHRRFVRLFILHATWVLIAGALCA